MNLLDRFRYLNVSVSARSRDLNVSVSARLEKKYARLEINLIGLEKNIKSS